MPLRRIPLEHLHNMRDLGGYPTTDGLGTKWDLLYRSDSPASLTPDEWNALKDLKITQLIDLRSESEQQSSPITPGYPVDFHAISLMKELDTGAAAASQMPMVTQAMQQFMGSMDLDYTKSLFGNLSGAVEILDLILDNVKSGGSTLFFCSAGKDRTGIVAALVLHLCDVAREDIIADYMVSSTYNEKGINQLLSSIPAQWAAMLPDKSVLSKYLDSAPETMASLLDSFEKQDIRATLADNGFGPDKQAELKSLMTEA